MIDTQAHCLTRYARRGPKEFLQIDCGSVATK